MPQNYTFSFTPPNFYLKNCVSQELAKLIMADTTQNLVNTGKAKEIPGRPAPTKESQGRITTALAKILAY